MAIAGEARPNASTDPVGERVLSALIHGLIAKSLALARIYPPEPGEYRLGTYKPSFWRRGQTGSYLFVCHPIGSNTRDIVLDTQGQLWLRDEHGRVEHYILASVSRTDREYLRTNLITLTIRIKGGL